MAGARLSAPDKPLAAPVVPILSYVQRVFPHILYSSRIFQGHMADCDANSALQSVESGGV